MQRKKNFPNREKKIYRYTPGNLPPAGHFASVSYCTDRLTGMLGSGMTVRFTDGPGMGFLLNNPLNSS